MPRGVTASLGPVTTAGAVQDFGSQTQCALSAGRSSPAEGRARTLTQAGGLGVEQQQHTAASDSYDQPQTWSGSSVKYDFEECEEEDETIAEGRAAEDAAARAAAEQLLQEEQAEKQAEDAKAARAAARRAAKKKVRQACLYGSLHPL